MNKREEIRLRRRRQKRRNQLTIVMVITGFVFLSAAFLIFANFRPVGTIVPITPRPRPMVSGNAMGDPNAPVLIEVFEDFQCPACQDYSERVEPQIVENYVITGEVYYVFRQFPFIDDRVASNESDHAATASLCAGDQGYFWDYHDILFANWNGENAGGFSDRRLIAFAETIGLDATEFKTCFDGEYFNDQIDQDFTEGRQRGVTGTPSVFVNGQQITPGFVPSFEDVSQAVEEALGRGGS